jgi:hypothetical protein
VFVAARDTHELLLRDRRSTYLLKLQTSSIHNKTATDLLKSLQGK